MSRWWLILGTFVAALLGGLVGAYTVARHVAKQELREGSFWFSMSISDAEQRARIPLTTLHAASEGNLQSVVRFNCAMLKLEARRLYLLLQADRDARTKDSQLEKLYTMSADTIKRLESQQKCPGRPWRTMVGEQGPELDADVH